MTLASNAVVGGTSDDLAEATRDVTLLVPVLREKKNTEWLRECVTGFPKGTKYLIAENDGDLAGAMNQALTLVDTEFVFVFGHDDVPADDMLDLMLAAGEDADVVYPSMILADEELNPKGFFGADPFCPNRLQIWNYVSGGFLARTETVRKAGGWRDLDALEDWDLHVRMSRTGARFKACPEAKFLYRQVEGSRNKLDTGQFATAREMREHWREKIVGTVPDVKATFYYQSTPATAYWRCLIPARHLPAVATSGLDGVELPDGTVDLPDHRGAAVFQFPADNERARALQTFQGQGVKYLVEVDDNYLDPNDAVWRRRAGWTLRIGRDRTEWRKHPHSVEGHRWITEHADGVIVSTRRLAEIYGEVNPNVYVCRNSIDPKDVPELVKPDDGVFRIGWFASQSHDRDADLIRKAMSWASRQPNVQVINVGLDPAGWNFARLQYGWSDDLSAYKRILRQLDVGMCPVEQTSSSVCRSDLKVLENAVAGAMSIVSRVEPYHEWFDTDLALSASTAKDFYDHVRWCVTHRDEAREMAARVRDHVLQTRTIQAEIGKWSEAVES